MDSLLSLSKYVDPLRKLTTLVPATQRIGVRYFMATDDAEAEKMMKSSFEDGERGLLFWYAQMECNIARLGGGGGGGFSSEMCFTSDVTVVT